jgi:hypothetical protein
MKRRSAIARISFWGVSSIAVIGGVNFFYSNKHYPIGRLKEHKELISILTDLILPRTETPGAKDANVSETLIKIVENCFDSKSQQTFINGLYDIEEYTKSTYGILFKDCTINIQNTILQKFEKKEQINIRLISKIKNKLFGLGFFSILKELTVECFFSSEIGATNALNYDYIPGKYIGCLNIPSNQKCWATQ